jgi:hypothetical protein
LPEEHETEVSRSGPQSLTNCAKPVQATLGNVAIERLGEQLRISIQDDRLGCVVSSAMQRGGGNPVSPGCTNLRGAGWKLLIHGQPELESVEP